MSGAACGNGTGRTEGPAPGPPVRLTWAQPEDLIGHELRQAAEDGRDARAARRAWPAAGGHPAPERAGASPTPAPPELRALASRLLDELASLPRPLSADEPDSWASIRAAWPQVPPLRGEAGSAPTARTSQAAPDTRAQPPTAGAGAGEARALGPAVDVLPTGPVQPAAGLDRGTRPDPGPRGLPRTTGDREPALGAGPRDGAPASRGPGADAGLRARLEAAWLGRAAGCLLGKPVEKLPLEGIRALARAAGIAPLYDTTAVSPGRAARAPTARHQGWRSAKRRGRVRARCAS